jgi:hypothetical protein
MKNKIFIAIIICFFLIGGFYTIYSRYQLKHNYEITVAHIYDIQVAGYRNGGDYSILYEFYVNGKKYINNNNYNYCGDLNLNKIRSLLKGKDIAVAYPSAAHNLGIGQLLLTQRDAERFNYKISDSLLIYDSIFTCK